MPNILKYLEGVNLQDKQFIGTIAFRSEELVLPDGSKIALGIDDGHWVLVYQKGAGVPFRVFECNWPERKILLDKKIGGPEEFKIFKKLLRYFLLEAKVDDLVTILPPQPA